MAARGCREGEMGVNYLVAIEFPFEIIKKFGRWWW